MADRLERSGKSSKAAASANWIEIMFNAKRQREGQIAPCMPLVLAVQSKIGERNRQMFLRGEGLRQRREVNQWGGRIDSALVESIECLDIELSDGAGFTRQNAPIDSRKVRTESELLVTRGFDSIFGDLILGVVPAETKDEKIVLSSQVSERARAKT